MNSSASSIHSPASHASSSTLSQNSLAYDQVNQKWKSTCRILLGEEIGDMEQYASWLDETRPKIIVKKSSLSGHDCIFAVPYYPNDGQFVRFEELDFSQKYSPLDINSIKDLDSLSNAVRERACYAGNIVLGTSQNVEESTGIVDSHYVYKSERFGFSKYIGHSNFATYCEALFAASGCGYSKYCIKPHGSYSIDRCFDVSRTDYSSDIYLSHGLSNCQHCFFCFNLKGMRHCIGNLALPPDKYKSVKDGLVEQVREELVKHKRVRLLIEIANSSEPDYTQLQALAARTLIPPKEGTNIKPIEEAWAQTSRLLFGRTPGTLSECVGWLSSNTPEIYHCKSVLSQKPVEVADYSYYPTFPNNRLLSMEETEHAACKLQLTTQEIQQLSMQNAGQMLSNIAYFTSEWRVGKTANIIECPLALESIDCWRNILPIRSKLCAVGYLPRNSEYLFGVNEVRESSHCVRCYQSARLTRCFECDSCRSCEDCLFCHNAEGCSNCMFCFNVKSMRYAIGNVEMKKEEYLRVKKMVLEEMSKRLEKDKSFPLSIFNIASRVG